MRLRIGKGIFAVVMGVTATAGWAAGALGGAALPLVDTDLDWFRARPAEVTWGQDPFRSKLPALPAVTAEPLHPAFVVSAIILGGEAPGAVVDGILVRPGGKIKGYSVDRIEQDRVFLSGRKGKIEIPLFPLYRLHETLP